MDMIAAHLGKPPPSPDKVAPQTPPELARLVVRMMAKAPEERPTLADLRAAFAKLREGKRGGGARTPRRATSVLIGAMLFLAGVIALGTIWMIQRNKNDAPAVVAQTGNAEGSALVPGATPGGSSGAISAGTLPTASGSSAAISAGPLPTANGSSAAVSAGAPPTASGSSNAITAADGNGSSAGGVGSAAGPIGAVPDAPAGGSASAGSAPAGGTTSSAAGSASVPKKRGPPKHVEEPELVTYPPPANRPGAILLTLEMASVIQIDGSTVAQGSYGGRYEVTPGHHEIRVKAAGRQPVVRGVDVEPGGTAVIRIDDDTSDSGDE
jgi:hypothetical protein